VERLDREGAAEASFEPPPISTGRIEAFSDGVFAVAITLLVLNLKIPSDLASEAQIWRALLANIPSLIAWVMSFFFVLTIWINHHYFFHDLRRSDRPLLWINGLLLLVVTFIPFPTQMVSQYPGFRAPLIALSGTMLMASLIFAALRYYASYRGGLLKPHIGLAAMRVAMLRSAVGPVLYAAALGLSFFSVLGAILTQMAALAVYIAGPRLFDAVLRRS
jgi:uncharacterized membrane protein